MSDKLSGEFIKKELSVKELDFAVTIEVDNGERLEISKKELKNFLMELGYGGVSVEKMIKLLKNKGVKGEQYKKRQRIIDLLKEKLNREK